MALIKYKLIGDVPTVDERGVRHRTRTYHAVTDPGDSSDVAIAGIPIARFSVHPNDLGAIAKSVDVEDVDAPAGIYRVIYRYDSEPFANATQSTTTADNPTSGNTQTAPTPPGPTDTPSIQGGEVPPDQRPIQLVSGSVKTTRPMTHGYDTVTKTWTVPIITSAGQPIDPVPELPTTHRTWTITCWRKASTFPAPAKADFYEDTVNTYPFLGQPAGTLRCNVYKFELVWESGGAASGTPAHGAGWYYKLDIELERNRLGWNPIRILDAGTVQGTVSQPPQPILDLVGNPIQAPIPLNGSGLPLNTGGTLVYNSYVGYISTDFDYLLDAASPP